MLGEIDQHHLAELERELAEDQHGDDVLGKRDRAAKRIQLILEGIARKSLLPGTVKMFGSFSNGFKTGASDMDVVFLGPVGPDAVRVLRTFADQVPNYGFENVTKIFQAVVPLVKFTDKMTGMEVDFCINNELGVRNSSLLLAYCEYDKRVLRLGRLVKNWAKRHDLVGTADGCLNSYAWMLLVVFFLQVMETPVCPNLQILSTESVLVTDAKWGFDQWETGFFEDVRSLKPSENDMTVGELLIRFFHYYAYVHDWQHHAVCMRLAQPGTLVDKFSLHPPSSKEQWYVEDPFDRKHNLAGKCTPSGRARILERMTAAVEELTCPGGSWARVCPRSAPGSYFLKCRVSPAMEAKKLMEVFENFELRNVHMPVDKSVRLPQAFLEFPTAMDRRKAHTMNETYVQDCQLQLHYTSRFSLEEAQKQGRFEISHMSSYLMQKRVVSQPHDAATAGGFGAAAAVGGAGASGGAGGSVLNPEAPSFYWIQNWSRQWDMPKVSAGDDEAARNFLFPSRSTAMAPKGLGSGSQWEQGQPPAPEQATSRGSHAQKQEAGAFIDSSSSERACLALRIRIDERIDERKLITNEQLARLRDARAYLQDHFKKQEATPEKQAVLRLQLKDDLPYAARQALREKLAKIRWATQPVYVAAGGTGGEG